MDYLSTTDAQLGDMLRTIGVGSVEELIRDVPSDLRHDASGVPAGLDETSLLRLMSGLAERNRPVTARPSFLGAGTYHHVIPTAVDAIASRGEWLTPYTPYQAEASQGLLQVMYEFQTMICELMQMEVANASLYDGASAVAEAAILALRATERRRIIVAETLHPHARQVLATYLSGLDVVVQELPSRGGISELDALRQALRDDVACVIMQQPNVFGCLEPMAQASRLTHEAGALFAASVYPISLGLLTPPGAYQADLAVAEGQCLGNPMAYGGPGLGLFATTTSLMRKIPGRLAGRTVDEAGRRAFTLTLQTREQHIRRERATSNICTNEGWLATRATIYLSLLGPEGLRELASQNVDHAHYARRRLLEIPWIRAAFDAPFFHEFVLQYEPGMPLATVHRKLMAAGLVPGLPLEPWYPTLSNASLWCVTEAVSRAEIDRLVESLRRIG